MMKIYVKVRQFYNVFTFRGNIMFIPNKDEILHAVGFINTTLAHIYNKIIVQDDIIYKGNTFSDVLVMYNCTFEGKVEFIDCTFDEEVSFKNCTFDKEVSFKNSTFKSKVSFENCKFNKTVNYDNTTFENLVYFYEVTFNNNQKFAFTDFLDRAFFSKVIFKKNVQFIYNKVKPDTIISFVDTEFEQLLDISRANFLCKLHFWNITIDLNFSNISLYKNDKVEDKEEELKGIVKELEGIVKELDDKVKALKKIRESFRIIKSEFRKAGNNIEALEFQKKEMLTYKEELAGNDIDRIKKWLLPLGILFTSFGTCLLSLEILFPSLGILFSSLGILFLLFGILFNADRTMLLFNKLSNNFGTSWRRGVFFTLIISSFFYLLYLCCLPPLKPDFSLDGLLNIVNNFLHFINITDWSFEPFGIKDSSKSYGILFIGRIFIGYGYYQTIQAFRKFGKN